MREIKFRAWNKEYSEMVYFDFGDFYDNYCYAGKHPIYDLDAVPVMQYTGLKDKKGKEIYEGDIVRFPYYRKSVEAPVGWGIDGWWASLSGWFKELYWVAGKCEVIGNIYDNPELLEKKDVY